jgi:hypothetical protein
VIGRHCEPTGPARSGRPDDKLREATQKISTENWIASSPSAPRNDGRAKLRRPRYFRSNFIASSANTPPVILIGSHLARAATCALVIMI